VSKNDTIFWDGDERTLEYILEWVFADANEARAAISKDAVERAVRARLGWDDDIDWDGDWDERAIEYVVELVRSGMKFERAMVHLVSSDVPLGRGIRQKIAGVLASHYFPPTKITLRHQFDDLLFESYTRAKAELQKAGHNAYDAKEKAAREFGMSADAMEQRIKRARRAHQKAIYKLKQRPGYDQWVKDWVADCKKALREP